MVATGRFSRPQTVKDILTEASGLWLSWCLVLRLALFLGNALACNLTGTLQLAALAWAYALVVDELEKRVASLLVAHACEVDAAVILKAGQKRIDAVVAEASNQATTHVKQLPEGCRSVLVIVSKTDGGGAAAFLGPGGAADGVCRRGARRVRYLDE